MTRMGMGKGWRAKRKKGKKKGKKDQRIREDWKRRIV